MLNPYFTDGTRLRVRPDQDADFNEQFILNDAPIEIVAIENGFARVRDLDHPDAEGWVRERNLARHKRESGLARVRRSLLEHGRSAWEERQSLPEHSSVSSAAEHSSVSSAAAPSAAPAAAGSSRCTTRSTSGAPPARDRPSCR
jgi:SH3-like domain-containing protein